MNILARAVLAVGKFSCYRALGLVARLRRGGEPARPARSFRRVLLAEISLLGDVVSFTSSLRAARAFWPEARIDVMVLRELAPVVLNNSSIDRVAGLGDLGAATWARAIMEVRRSGYDLVLSMSPGLRNAGAAILGSAGASAGYLVDRGFPPHFLNPQRIESVGVRLPQNIDVPPGCHVADRGLKVLEALGAEVPGKGNPDVVVDDAARAHVGLFLKGAGIAGRPFAVIHPSAGERSRRWPLERFVELARRLSEDMGLPVIWIGGASDAGIVSRARRASRGPSAAFSGRPAAELLALMQRASLFVGNDSGPMHVAGAVGTPLVGMFGPGDPARLLPRSRNARALGGPGKVGLAAVTVEAAVEAARQVVAIGRRR